MNAMSEIFGRNTELTELAQRFETRHSFVLWGPAGAGKTLLIRNLLPRFPQVIYCPESENRGTAFIHLWKALISLQTRASAKSSPHTATAARGRVMQALAQGGYTIILDHLHCPSRMFANEIRNIQCLRDTQIIAVARSAHMEELGYLHGLYPERRERYELRNFEPEMAEAFLDRLVKSRGLEADNLLDFQERALHASKGNPGTLARLVELAADPRYRGENGIKFSPLYIDYCLGITVVPAGRETRS